MSVMCPVLGHYMSSPLDEGGFSIGKNCFVKLSHALFDLVQQEVNKLLKGKQFATKQVNFFHIHEFASKTDLNMFCSLDSLSACWIIDTGATSHICAYENNF